MPTNTALTYALQNATREDLLDIIINISPTETPILSAIPHKSCNATLHEWLTDSLRAPAENHIAEGADAVYEAAQQRVRLKNVTQIFENGFSVSETQRVVVKAGIDDEYAYQATKAMKMHALDTEYAILNNGTTYDTGSGGSHVRIMAGIRGFIDSGNAIDKGGNQALEIEDIETAYQNAWKEGGNPTVIFCGPKTKRRITQASGSTPQRTIPATEHKEVQRTDIYEGELGTMMIRPHRLLASGEDTPANTYMYLLDMNYWRFDYLRRPKEEELAKTGDAKNGHIISEGTLVGLAPKANAYITNYTLS